MRVLVADDHSLFRDGIVSLLEAAGFDVVGQAGDGQAAVEAALRLRPDLVLLDIGLPKLNGLEALKRIRQAEPDLRVVMLTVSDEDADLFEAIRLGANGYMLKNLTAKEFLEMIEGLDRGEAAISRRTATRLMQGFGGQRPTGSSDPSLLTRREVELLQLVAQGFSNKAIAAQLTVSENTVKYHIRNILQKLGVQNRTEAAAQAIRQGLIKPR
jgi:DNA-binding NarL/FixJ family response regulator